mmetsp:Transcript_34499/g.50655  ORF Transcript_34499/g.50655 Transcript_34499/m.50655 type:complete len:328 (+) Transcript_34499:40-1023(+)
MVSRSGGSCISRLTIRKRGFLSSHRLFPRHVIIFTIFLILPPSWLSSCSICSAFWIIQSQSQSQPPSLAIKQTYRARNADIIPTTDMIRIKPHSLLFGREKQRRYFLDSCLALSTIRSGDPGKKVQSLPLSTEPPASELQVPSSLVTQKNKGVSVTLSASGSNSESDEEQHHRCPPDDSHSHYNNNDSNKEPKKQNPSNDLKSKTIMKKAMGHFHPGRRTNMKIAEWSAMPLQTYSGHMNNTVFLGEDSDVLLRYDNVDNSKDTLSPTTARTKPATQILRNEKSSKDDEERRLKKQRAEERAALPVELECSMFSVVTSAVTTTWIKW